MNVANGIVRRVSKIEAGHLCYMRPLKDVLRSNTHKVLYVFYDFETTQYKSIPILQKHMCLTSSACNSFVRGVRTWKAL